MKKLAIYVFSIFLSFAAYSQKNHVEIGARAVAEVTGPGQGISFDAVFPISRTNRLHLDAGIIGGGFASNLLVEWTFPIPDLRSLVFYPGVGGGIWTNGPDFNIALVGVGGIEYRFDFPLTIGFEARPRFDFIMYPGVAANVNLIARYRF
jgi:hypothetical protein